MLQRKPMAALLALAFSGLAQAQQAGSTTLDEVLVQERPLSSLPRGGVVDQNQLAGMRAATSDTASLLRDVPGVSLYGAGAVSSLPVLRGLADDRLRIKVDGMDLVASCPNHMNPPLSYVDPSEVERIQVYAGIAPVSVGGDSIGGAIVVETAKPEFAQPGAGLLTKGEVGAFYRSNGDGYGGHVSATVASENFSLSYTGSTAQADNYKAGGKFKEFTATGRPGHELARDEVGSTAYETRNHTLGLAMRGGNHLFEVKLGYQDLPYQLYPNQRMDMLDNQEKRLSLRYEGKFDGWRLEARAFHEKVDHFMDFGADKQYYYGSTATILAPGMPMYTKSKTSGLSLLAEVDLNSAHTLRLGGDYLRYRLDDWWPASPSELPPGYTSGGMAPWTFENIKDGQRDRLGLFGELESRWNPAWTTLAGLRLERVHTDAGKVHGYNDVMAGYAVSAAAFNASDRDQTDHNLDLTALARYTPDAGSSIEFGYAMKTRSPNLYERYSWSRNSMALIMNNFVGDGNGYLGDPDLKPEKAHTLSAAFDWHGPERQWEFRLSPHYTYVQDYIDAVRCQGSGTMMNALCGGAANNTATEKFVQLQYANQDARLYGVDISGALSLARNDWGSWGLKGMVNYLRGKNRETGDDLYNIMPLNARVSLTHQLGGWNNALEVVGVKGKERVSDVRQEIRTPGYGLVNLRASHAWKQVRLDLGVENLFDKLYYLPTGGAYAGQGMTMSTNGIPWGIVVPGAGRSLYAGLTIKF